MPNDSYEFSYMDPTEKRKILIGKCFLSLLIANGFFWLVSDKSSTLSSDLIQVSGILCAIFGYINLINVKSELMELFEPPYEYTGYEFLAAGFLLNLISWFI